MRLQKVHLTGFLWQLENVDGSFYLIDDKEKCHKPNLAQNDSTKWTMHKEGPQRHTVRLGKVRPVRFEWCLGIRPFRPIALFSFWALSILTYQIVFIFCRNDWNVLVFDSKALTGFLQSDSFISTEVWWPQLWELSSHTSLFCFNSNKQIWKITEQ